MATPIPFDYAQFIIDYPEFVGYSSSTNVTNIFNNQATVIGQIVASLFKEVSDQYYWLCLTLAHILARRKLGLTGRLSNVTQGSESASFEFNSPQWASYWNTTVYGQDIYQCIMEYAAGGTYFSDGSVPYLGESMNGAYSLAWVQT